MSQFKPTTRAVVALQRNSDVHAKKGSESVPDASGKVLSNMRGINGLFTADCPFGPLEYAVSQFAASGITVAYL